jgi:hypothetical protein
MNNDGQIITGDAYDRLKQMIIIKFSQLTHIVKKQ